MAVLTSTHNLYLEQKFEKYQSFLSENFQLLEMKFSIFLNRRVFVTEIQFSKIRNGLIKILFLQNFEVFFSFLSFYLYIIYKHQGV